MALNAFKETFMEIDIYVVFSTLIWQLNMYFTHCAETKLYATKNNI